MIAKDLIVEPLLRGDKYIPIAIADKLNELIDKHNTLVRSVLPREDTPLTCADLMPGFDAAIKKGFAGMSDESPIFTTDWHNDPQQSWEPGRKANKPHAPALRFVHNLLIAWGRTCQHVCNRVVEPLAGMLKCQTCGLPYIPTGDGD